MSFAETRLDLGIDYNTRGSLRYSASIIVDGVGNEQRNASWGQPLGRWQIGDRSLSRRDLDYFLKFHAARKGARHGFRFKDWADYKALRQPIGIGDGTTRQFQLTKTYTVGSSSVKRPILKPVGGTIKIYLNRIEHLDDWTINVTQGIVTFNAAPDSDTVITADFEFDVPVRFEQDRIEFRFDAHDSNSHDAIFYLASLSCAELRLLPTLPIAPDPIGSTLEEILNLGYDYGTLGGPTYDTTITTVGANYEARVDNWETSRGRWQIGDRTLNRAELDYLIAFHRVVRGSARSFVYKDWASSLERPVRFDSDNIEFRFDALDPKTHEAIFYLSGLSVVEITNPMAIEQDFSSFLFNTGFGSGWSGVQHLTNSIYWFPNDSNSKWISHTVDTSTEIYRADYLWDLAYSFYYDSILKINGRALVDNQIDDILVNGVSQNIFISNNFQGTWAEFTLTGFRQGVNTIIFKIRNFASRQSGNPTACRVEWTGCIKLS